MPPLALTFDILAKDNASSTFRDVGNAAERAGKQSETAGASIARGMKMAGAAVAGLGLVAVFKDAVGAASNLNETVNKTNVIFGQNAAQVQRWAQGSARNFGLSKQAALEAASGFGNMLTQLGYTGDAALEASTSTVKLAADLGSFNNLDTGDVLDRIGAAMRGEYDSLQLLIPNINAARVQQEAMAATGKSNADSLTAQEKAAATLAIVQRDGAAAADDFAETSDGLANSTKIMAAQWEDAKAKLGELLVGPVSGAVSIFNNAVIPAFEATVGVVGDLIGAFGDLPAPVQVGVVALGAVAALKGPLSSAFETIALRALYMKDSFSNASLSMGGLKTAGSGIVSFFGGPWGLAFAAAAAGVTLLTSFLGKNNDVTEDAANYQRDLSAALKESNGVINENVRALAAKQAAEKEVGDSDLLAVADDLGFALPKVTDALLGNRDAYNELRNAANAYYDESLLAKNAGDPEFTEKAESARLFIEALDELAPTMGRTVAENERVAAATSETGAAMSSTTALTGESAAALDDWLKKLQGIGEGFVEPLSIYQELLGAKQESERASAEATAEATASSSDSWEDYVSDVGISLADYAQKLQDQLTAQQNWRTNIVLITQAGGIEVGQQLLSMGQEGAGLVQQMVDAIGTEEFPRMRDLMIQEAAAGGAGAAAALDNEMKVMAAVGAAGASATVTGIATQLGIGIAEVQRIAGQYGLNLASGINPILTALGKQPIAGVGGRLGGFNEYYDGGFTGDGGKYTPAGIVHAGEFVFTKEQTRKAGVGNLEAMAQSLKGYATGGFVSEADVPRPPSTAPYRMPISTAGDAAMDTAYKATADWMREGGPYANALAFAKSQVGKPYIWGGVGPAGYDCSGFMSAITNVLLGKSPHSRRGATANFPWGGFVSGDGAFTIGSTKDAGGGIGHMAGTLFGTNVESRGGQGVVVGPSARGAHNGLFSTRAHLAMANGGVIGEPVAGVGLNSGRSYSFGESGPETVTPGLPGGMSGLEITGTLEIGGDGLARIVDGRIVSALTMAGNRRRYNG